MSTKKEKTELLNDNFSVKLLPFEVADSSDTLILYFWSPFCSHCKTITPKLLEKEELLKSKNIEIFCITAPGDEDYLNYYINNNPLPGEVILDNNGEIGHIFNVTATPEIWIFSDGSLSFASGLEQILKTIEEYE